ncbi:MAG: C69 family dipeptidase [Candidatus Limiplasma sp.]|nr:C69 family dipeptidase [Candidatus Limiplasma sp.]
MTRIPAALLLIVFLAAPLSAGACTTVIVGRDASADGSLIYGRTVDGEGFETTQIVTVPAQTLSEPYRFVSRHNGLTLELPAESCQYVMTPAAPSMGVGVWAESALNEHGVSISATESIYGGPELLQYDPYVPNGVSEESIATLVIPYVKTAREGVARLGSIVTEHGSAEGCGVIIADETQAWYMEIYSGHHWLAVRAPDDQAAVIANDAMIGCADIDDTENVLASPDFWQLAQENGFLVEVNAKPHAALTYGQPHRDYSQIRVWAGQRYFVPSQAQRYDVTHTYELFFTPDRPIELQDVMELTRYRFEDTLYNANEHNQWRPIGINRALLVHLFWYRPKLPTVSWVALANSEFSVFLPMYGNLTSTPAAYTYDCNTYDENSAYSVYRWLSTLASLDRTNWGYPVRMHWRAMEKELIANMAAMDEAYIASGYDGGVAARLFSDIAQRALQDARDLTNALIPKIISWNIEGMGASSMHDDLGKN